MQKQRHRFIAILFAAIIPLGQSLPSKACGPFFPYNVYAYYTHPDIPMKKFAAGELGIVHPGMAMSYLYIAYRYFTDRPLNEEQQNASVALWHQRLQDSFIHDENMVKPWLEIHNSIPQTKKLQAYDISLYRSIPDDYTSQLIISSDAFVNAANTLKERIKTYGINSKQVKAWVENQDIVFSNCSYEAPKNVITPKPLANADSLCKADYAYQNAAANFYAGKIDIAKKLFEQISKDQNSPWHKLAKYLVARCVFQQLVQNEKLSADNTKIKNAETYFQSLLSDKDLSPYKSDIKGFLDYLSFYTQPLNRYKQLVNDVLDVKNKNLTRSLDDYTLILDSFQDNAIKTNNLLSACKKDDISVWILDFAAASTASTENKKEIFTRWQKQKNTSNALPWLIAALAVADIKEPATNELISAAKKIPANSPAYLTAQYYLIKLLIKNKNTNEAKALLDNLLKLNLDKVPPSAHNTFVALRQQIASSLDEYLNYGLKEPVATSSFDNTKNIPDDYQELEKKNSFKYTAPATFDIPLVIALNHQLPLSVWHKLATDSTINFPAQIKNEIISATWTRAILLNDEHMAMDLAPKLQFAYPQLKAPLDAYIKAKNNAERNFAACYVLLCHPGISIYIRGDNGRFEKNIKDRDDYGDNFWVAEDPKSFNQKNSDNLDNPNDDMAILPASVEPYLSASEKQQALSQAYDLYKNSGAAKYAFNCTQAWMKINPMDKRIPEILYVITKMPRWGGRNIPQASKYSKEAYTILHTKYVGNPWTKKAQYYY